jgi:flagellar biosynthetic protein FliP
LRIVLTCFLLALLATPLAAQTGGSANSNLGGPVAAQIPLPKPPVAPFREAEGERAVDVVANRLPLDGEPAPAAGLEQLLSPSGLTPTLKVMMLLSLLSVAPAVLIMTTSFVRFVIVFGLLRQALGTQQLPPTQVLTSLSVFLTLFVMTPIWQQAWDEGVSPYVNEQPIPNLEPDEDRLKRVFLNTFRPIKRFMAEQIHRSHGEDIVFMLLDFRRPDPESLAGQEYVEPENFEDVEPSVIVTAFMLSELKTAFLIGFKIFLPFLVIDFVVSTLLTSMGMMMMPPTLVSLPFKLLLFVLIDGWTLVTHMLLLSVSG